MAYLNREKLLQIFAYETSNTEFGQKYYAGVYQKIMNMPTADVVEVKHGEWTLHSDGSGTCNLCGKTQKSVWDFDNVQNYCGKCGAKMDGERKEDK